MLESIYVGMTGLLGYSRGLRVIANNTANLNTPGFKSSSLQFTDLFYTGANLSGGGTQQGPSQLGFGLNTAGTSLSFKQGELRQTGNELDLSVDGQGLFVLENEDGQTRYTRAGQFKFDPDGTLVNRIGGEKVMASGENGKFVPISIAGQGSHNGQPTTKLKFEGTLNAKPVDNASQSIEGITVIDSAGTRHALILRFSSITPEGANMSVKVELMDASTVLATGKLVFANGKPTAQTAQLALQYKPTGLPPQALTLDFGTGVSLLDGATTLKLNNQDGIPPGTLSGAAFDDTGTLRISYTNGQTVKGARLALARFDSPDAVVSLGGNQFDIADKAAWHFGSASEGAFGKVVSGRVEISNVDLSQEFSDLVIMQRGYQASSQVVSTANEMLQQLFSMKSK
ncbi:flagellar hook protein FlgE [Variovorax sp. PDC80]|jgi:flagellar hook protein FlgE|uniref:flagellar hook protein FlgE n=1 Tax=Variovorax sp. PDC80 TaxID=1882827 RepID=UPI0008F2BDFE|nr:flagellar hook-basal body complex protein [Variovorax sp. PDC80]SFO54159.1 flagellar hook protein FlgE [Variovorax sp. PDC80]